MERTTSARAFHVAVPGQDVKTKEWLYFLRNGELHWDRVRIHEDRSVEVFERDDIPDEVAEYGGIIDDPDEHRTFILEDDGTISADRSETDSGSDPE